jgi:hypothetical protein
LVQHEHDELMPFRDERRFTFDIGILAILQREGRISKAELAGRVGLSHGMHWAAASTIW